MAMPSVSTLQGPSGAEPPPGELVSPVPDELIVGQLAPPASAVPTIDPNVFAAHLFTVVADVVAQSRPQSACSSGVVRPNVGQQPTYPARRTRSEISGHGRESDDAHEMSDDTTTVQVQPPRAPDDFDATDPNVEQEAFTPCRSSLSSVWTATICPSSCAAGTEFSRP